MALVLLGEALLEEAAQLVEGQGLERRELLGAELGQRQRVVEPAQQLLGGLRRELPVAEDRLKHLIPGVELRLVLDEDGARHAVEVGQIRRDDPAREDLHQRHPLADADRQAGPAEPEEQAPEEQRAAARIGACGALAHRQRRGLLLSLAITTSRSRLRSVPMNGTSSPAASRSIPLAISAASQSTSSLVDGRLRSPSTLRRR